MTEELEAIWQKVEKRWDAGFEKLTKQEQQTIAIWWLESENNNGTLNQFFWNNAGEMALIAREGLVRLQQHAALAALDSALAYFGPDYPEDRDEPMKRLELIEAQHGENVFNAASYLLQDLPQSMTDIALQDLVPFYENHA